MAQYPDYPDKAWDEDAIKEARKYMADQPRVALAIAGTVRHPERRSRLQNHIDQLISDRGLDQRPFMVQVAQDVLGEAVVWPPEAYVQAPKARPKTKVKRRNGAN